MSLRHLLLSATVLSLLVLTGCGPVMVEKWAEVKPNETAFVVPLEDGAPSGQAKFNSIDYLLEAKVSRKRYILPQRQVKTGHMPWQYEWKETEKVIVVDRSPITREWSGENGLSAESVESIGFTLGATITCSVAEEDAHRFLYYYAGKPLGQVVDSNVRGFFQKELTQEFGKVPLDRLTSQQSDIFDRVLVRTRDFFQQRGVTIETFGAVGGIRYENPKLQEAMDRKFTAFNDIGIARQEQAVAVERNKILVEKARKEKEAADELFKAKEAALLRTSLTVQKLEAEALHMAAQNWNGQLPTGVVPQGSGILFGLDRPVPPPVLEPAPQPKEGK
jgi:hypothetical protein